HGGDIFANKVRGVNCSGYFYMYGGEIYNHVNSSVDGAGAYIITVPYFSGGSFHDNTGNNGGGVYLKESKYVYEFGEVEFKNNTAKNGGGMFVEGSELYSVETAFDGTIFDGNTATQYGGGLYLGANSGATLSSTTTIKNNVAVDGAGVYASDQTVSLTTAATFDGNTASHFGGGLYVAQDADLAFDTGSVFNQNSVRNEESTVSGGAIYFAGGTYEVKGAFTSNSSLSTSGYGHGGAIYAVSSTLTFTDATFDGNDCKTSGAAVFLSSSSLNFASGSMNQNTAGYAGSGIALMGANTVTIESGVTIQNGTSSNGAIFMQGRSSSNQAVLEMKGKLSNNTATNGGGIYANSNAKIKLYSSALISLCKAAANGGGVCLNKSSSLENEETHGLNFINNCSAKNGGGIYVGDSSIATIWGGISNSTATADGGGIYLKSNTSEVLLWSKIYGCSANRGGGIFGNTGSAINIDGEIYSGSINNCEASYGGGIYLFSNNNTATSQIGGKITGCTATKNGGGLYSDNISNLTFNGEILGCSASKNGGGIYSVDSTLNLGTTSISARVETCAADVGGGVYVTGGSGNFVGGLISGNTAKYGGGLASANSAEITLGIVDDLYHGGDTGFIVTLNTATRFGGGAYFASGSSVLMDDGVSINSNKVQNLLTITKELQIGTAPQTISYTYTYAYSDRGIGAGVFLDNDVVMTMQGDHWCEVIGNEVIADNSTDDQLFKMCLGGGISVSGTSTLIMNDGWISNNSVDTKITNSVGGNVNVGPDGTFKMSGGTISGNGYLQATLGGGILSTGVVEVTGGLIDSCVAKYGGGIASYGGYKVEYSSYSYDLSRNTLSIGGDVVVENCVALGETDDNQTAHSSTGHIGDGVLVGGIINFSGNPKFVNNSVALSAQKNIYVKVVVNIGIDKARYPTINASKDFSPVNPITLNFVQASLTITSISDKTIEYSVSNSSDLLDAYYSGSDGGSQVPLVVGDSDITDFVLASGKSIYGVKNESTSDEYIYVGTLTVQAVASNNETIFVKPAEVYFDKKSFLKHVQVK
ncbi:MAG: hypothetical protein IJW24_00965, partial [Clostridia bacterium]|nr:hypothetical protein [Clostridia bacterium]